MKATIAIADDHRFLRNGIAELLERFNYRITIKAANGQDLIDQLSKAAVLPEVCLMDVNMPFLNGIDATQRISSMWPAISVIGFSMDDDEATKRNMLNAGAKAYLLKGSDIGDICACIDGLVNIEKETKSA